MWTELTILNLTQNTDNINKHPSIFILLIFFKKLKLGECKLFNKISKNIKAKISTKSQLHHPPQESSCSAHQHPNIIAVKIKSTIKKSSIFLNTVIYFFVFLL